MTVSTIRSSSPAAEHIGQALPESTRPERTKTASGAPALLAHPHAVNRQPGWTSTAEEAKFHAAASRHNAVKFGREGDLTSRTRAGNNPMRARVRTLRRVYTMMKGPVATQELGQRSDMIVNRISDGHDLEESLQDEEVIARFISLREAQEKIPGGAANDLMREKLELALKKIWNTHRQRILSEINTAGAIAEFSKKISDRDQLRRIYYDSILSGSTLRETFERLLQAFTRSRMSWALRALRNAVVDDISARSSAADIIRLEQGARHLEQVAKINSVHLYVKDLGARLDAPSMRSADGVFDFMRSVLRYAESNGGAKRFAGLCEEIVGADRADSPHVRRQVRLFLREKIPLSLWTDLATRETLTSYR